MNKKSKIFYAIIISVISFMAFASEVFAQNISVDLGNPKGGSSAETIFRLFVILTILSLAPSILMMVTSFTRIIVVLSLLRSAIGIQQTPPNVVLISLAMFLTFFIMQPVFNKSYDEGIKPLIENKIEEVEAMKKIAEPFREFMLKHVREDDLAMFTEIAEEAEGKNNNEDKKSAKKSEELAPYKALIPAFMISELRRAFEIGFLMFIPFLIIDMAIASILMSMGMMMLPPVLISLPFKIIFFVIIDGWAMLSESLIRGFQ